MKCLLHACCATCGAYIIEQLKKSKHDVSVYFYNPNIYPEDEYNRRRADAERYAKSLGVAIIPSQYLVDDWLTAVRGHESDLEGGKRCELCFAHRLGETAQKARELGFDCFATTLTISPHKSVKLINEIGRALADFYGLKFLDNNWQADSGFQKSCRRSKEEGFYRQNYCGCQFGLREK